jgi:hypothetical protein
MPGPVIAATESPASVPSVIQDSLCDLRACLAIFAVRSFFSTIADHYCEPANEAHPDPGFHDSSHHSSPRRSTSHTWAPSPAVRI